MCEHEQKELVEINSRQCSIDKCLAPIVIALNNSGIKTVASCCGHGYIPGRITLRDGRELVVMDSKQCNSFFDLFTTTIHGEKIKEIEEEN